MAKDYDGPERRNYDSTARSMAVDAKNAAVAVDKMASVVAERLDGHIKECVEERHETRAALGTMRKMLWGLLTVGLAGLLTALLSLWDSAGQAGL